MKTEIKPEEVRLGISAIVSGVEIGVSYTVMQLWLAGKVKLYPIPLTEEKLIELGFGLVSGVWTLENQWFEIEQLDKGLWFTTYGRDVELLHVHQLQNLYYALTQTELIK